MSKIGKLIKNPNAFFRDFFLKRAPLNYGDRISLLPIEKGESYMAQNTTQPKPQKKVTQQNTSLAPDEQVMEDLYPIPFPIDVVYTWVDSDDPEFNEQRLRYQNDHSSQTLSSKPESTDIARFQSRDELKYSVRSVFQYAPWVNHIYIVTNGQIPKWLDTDHARITVVPHSEIIDEAFLPTFNSHVIESFLYKIPNLSEHYLYFNDDVMLTRNMSPSYFFTSSGLAKLFITNAKLPNAPKNPRDTPTQWAAKNGRDLLYAETGFYVENMFAHTFHPQIKSVHQQMETLWHTQLNQCRKNRFRDIDDLNAASFLHHHFALITGKAIATRTKCMYFNIRSKMAEQHYRTLLARKGTEYAPHSVCLNDHIASNEALDKYEEKLQLFLETYYPEATDAELTLPTKNELAEQIKKHDYAGVYALLNPIIQRGQASQYNKAQAHIFYYFGVAAFFLHKEHKTAHYLNAAQECLKIFCEQNPQHKLAHKYLDDITQLLNNPSEAS